MRTLICLLVIAFPTLSHTADQIAATGRTLPLETFEKEQPAAFPGQWKVRGDEKEAQAIYRVMEENGNRFLHARADKQGVQIGLTHSFQPKEFPQLSWRWRVGQLPPGADERTDETNDSAAAVYVVFDNRVMPRAIKYVWSSTVPVGTRADSPTYWRSKVVVLQSGPSSNGAWQQETVNIYQDYKDLFGNEPGEVQGIAVLTDSDTTKSVAEADYDDFTLLAAGEAPAENQSGAATPLFPVTFKNR
ncbi:MAG: DUF3047 domain-containing protein [Candidatus Binatia bacterium]